MQKVAIVTMKNLREELLTILQQEGVIDITEAKDASKADHTEVKFREAELQFAITTLKDFASKTTLQAMKKAASEEEIEMAALQTDIRGIIDQVHSITAEIDKADQKLKTLRGSSEYQLLSGAMQDAVMMNETVDKAPQSTSPISPADKQKANTIVLEEKHLKSMKEEATIKLTQLSEELPNLARAAHYLHWLDQKQAVREVLRETTHTLTLFGWMPKKQVPHLEHTLAKLSPATAVLRVKPQKNELAPIQLKNSKLIKPFESVTKLYGLPKNTEIDPTLLLSPFFILFFGLCLTDAGYGLVLAIVMAIFLWKTKQTIEDAPLWWLLMMSGLFTVVVSIPFGGWFGMDPNAMPEWLTKPNPNPAEGGRLFLGQIWNLSAPSGITFFQNLAIALGIIHLSLGFFMAGYMKWRSGDKAGAFWVDWTTLVLFACIGAYFLVPAEQQNLSLYGIYGALALVVWGKGRGSSLLLRPLVGLLGLLNLAMGMLSNTLSYLRLLALGLVTGALALAVNLVAQQMGAMLPIYLAIPLMIVIYIGGHVLNIALNVLGAFIHSGRLQFVEFFGAFFEGGGRAFRPFKRALSIR